MDGEWSVIANVKPEAFGRATSPGTKHFVAGTKVWAVDWYWGMGGERLRVIGRHRGSSQLILLTMRTDYLTNWRAKVTYHPHVVRLLREHRATRDQAECERLASYWTKSPPIEDLAEQAATLARALHLLADDPLGQALARSATAIVDGTEPSSRAYLLVLSDWLEEQGAPLPLATLCTTLRRRRDNAP